MNKGDRAKIRRGPLSGREVVLIRHDAANRAWYATIIDDPKNTKDGHKVLVYEFELAETVERKGRGR